MTNKLLHTDFWLSYILLKLPLNLSGNVDTIDLLKGQHDCGYRWISCTSPNTHQFLLCEDKNIFLNAIFCGAAVSRWLIWLWNHTILPQQKQKGAQMNRSWPPNLPVMEKECTTRFLLNTFISMTFSWTFFCRIKWEKKEKCLWTKIRLSEDLG